MSLEQKIEVLTAAIEKLTAQLSGATVTATVTPEAKADKPAPAEEKAAGKKAPTGKKAPAAPKVTKEQATAAIMKLKNDFSFETAKAVMTQFGIKVADITDDNAADILAAADAKYTELSGAGEEVESDDGL